MRFMDLVAWLLFAVNHASSDGHITKSINYNKAAGCAIVFIAIEANCLVEVDFS